MRVEDVVDRESLAAYLKSLPDSTCRKASVSIAYQEAARVLPIAVYDYLTNASAIKSDLTPIALFGSLSMAGVAAVSLTSKISEASSAVSDVIFEIEFNRSHSDAGDSSAGDSAVSAASAAETVFASHSADAASYSAEAAADTVASASSAYYSVNHNSQFQFDPDLMTRLVQIWPNGISPPALISRWTQAKQAMAADTLDWSFWIAWYERVLAGKDTFPAMLSPILSPLRKGDWKNGPAHINPMFDEVLAAYAADGAKAGELISVNQAGEFFAEPVSDLSKDIHAEAIDRVGDAIADLRAEVSGTQSRLGCMIDVLATVERWLDWYDDRPLRLYEKLADAMDRVAEIALDNGLLEDAAIRVLLREIERSRTDLRANDAKIEARIRSRVRVRYDEMDEPQKQIFQEMIRAGAAGSAPALRQEMNEDLPPIQDPNAPNDEKERALVREAERTIQMRQLSVEGAAKKAKEFNDISKAGGTIGAVFFKLWGFFT